MVVASFFSNRLSETTVAYQVHLKGLVQVAAYVGETPIGLFCPQVASGAQVLGFGCPNTVVVQASSLNRRVLETQQPLLLNTLHAFSELVNAVSSRTKMIGFYGGFPVMTPQQVYGVLVVMDYCERVLTQRQQDAIAQLANQMACFIAMTEELAQLRHHFPVLEPAPLILKPSTTRSSAPLALTTALQTWEAASPPPPVGIPQRTDLSVVLQDCLSFQDLRTQLVKVLPTALPLSAIGLATLDQSGQRFSSIMTWDDPGQNAPRRDGQSRYHYPVEFHKSTFSEEQFVALLQKQSPDPNPDWDYYPLMAHGQLLGVLKLRFVPNAIDLPRSHPEVFEQITQQIAFTLRRLHVLNNLRSETLQDPLTQLYNRRYMMTFLQKLLKRVGYGSYQAGLILVDIDHFKRVNDTYGHGTGDYVLRVLGLFLKGHARPSDAVCRYGGEEFALILPDVSLAVAMKRAEKLRRSIKYLNLTHEGTVLKITLSAGVAIAPHHGTTPAALIKAADSALYQAKAQGRDQVVCPNSPS